MWKNRDETVTLNFLKGTFQQRLSGRTAGRRLIVLPDEGNEIRLRIGGDNIRAWVDDDGGLVLTRKTTMKFRCWIEGKLHRLCPLCRYLSPSEEPNCIACGSFVASLGQTLLAKNAYRMMTSADARQEGIEITFADGQLGLVPFAEIPEVNDFKNLRSVELPNPYEVVLHTGAGEAAELPWDFVRHYCDDSYRPRVEAVALAGKQSIGVRIRQFRESARLTQEALAQAAGIGRVTLVRIESGDQSPRYETLVSLAQALGRPMGELVDRGEDSA